MATSGDMKSVLSDERVTAIQDIAAHHETAAINAQEAFKIYALIFILATATASFTAALILFGAGAGDGADSHPVAQFINREVVQNLLYVI